MSPAAQLELASQAGISLFRIPLELRLIESQRGIINPEIYAIAVTQLRVARPGACRITVENRTDQREVIGDVGAEPSAQGCQRWRWPSARKIERHARRPAQ